MGQFFNLSYWFNTRPGSLPGRVQMIYILMLALLLAVYFIMAILKKRQRGLYFKIWSKLSNFFITNFFIGLLLLFFTFELVPFLSSRFWFLIWGLTMIGWLVYIVLMLLKIPKIKEEQAKLKVYQKYIP